MPERAGELSLRADLMRELEPINRLKIHNLPINYMKMMRLR